MSIVVIVAILAFSLGFLAGTAWQALGGTP
jgi:hypothetical protein